MGAICCHGNQSSNTISKKNLMQPFPKPDDTLNEIWLKLVLISPIFQLNRDGSSWVEPVLSLDKFVLLKDHNAVTPVRLEPAVVRSRFKHSTTETLRSRG